MERRRNRPEKYDRELVQKTVKAMEKITEVCPQHLQKFQNPLQTLSIDFLLCHLQFSRLSSICCGVQGQGACPIADGFMNIMLQVRQKRQDRYHEARMRKAKVQQTQQAKSELERDINLVRESAPEEEQMEEPQKEVQPPVKQREKLKIPVEKSRQRMRQ